MQSWPILMSRIIYWFYWYKQKENHKLDMLRGRVGLQVSDQVLLPCLYIFFCVHPSHHKLGRNPTLVLIDLWFSIRNILKGSRMFAVFILFFICLV